MISALRVRRERRPIAALGESDIAGLVLGASQNQLQVDFVSPDFHPGARLRYQYRLEDVHVDRSAPTEERTVNFAALAAGSYRLLVRAVTIDGNVSDNSSYPSLHGSRAVQGAMAVSHAGLMTLAGTV